MIAERQRSMRSRAPLPNGLSANLIFGSREQKQYRKFQAQDVATRPQTFGALPTAEQYAAFQLWCQKNDSGYFSDTPLSDLITSMHCEAQKDDVGKRVNAACGHALHPTQWSDREDVDRCPVCTVEMHTVYMDMIMQAVKKSGGNMEQRWEAAPASNPTLEAFYIGKIALMHAIGDIEELAAMEESWDQNQPIVGSDTKDDTQVRTAQEALRMYWATVDESSCSDNSRPMSPSSSSSSSSEASQKKQKKQCITFGEDTHFERGRDQHYFWRKSPRYEAGGKYDVVALSQSSADGSVDDEGNAADDEGAAEDVRVPILLACAELPFEGETEIGSKMDQDSDEECDDEEEEDEDESDEEDFDEDSEDDSEEESDDECNGEETAFIEFGY